MNKDVNKIVITGLTAIMALVLIVAAGCASGGRDMGGASTFRMEVGAQKTTATDMLNETQDVLRREQFSIFRVEPPPAPLVESEWRNQTPFEDEQEMGVQEVRCKVTVQGRERAPSGSIRSYRVNYTMDVQVKKEMSGEWVEMALTPQRREMARDLGRELQTALEVAQR